MSFGSCNLLNTIFETESEDSISDSDTENILQNNFENFKVVIKPSKMTQQGSVVAAQAEIMPVLKKEYLDITPEFDRQSELLPRFLEVY